MHVIKSHINGNPNIGLYGFATDKFCLVGNEVPEKLVKQIKEILQVPVFELNIAGTSLLGAFLAGNEDHLLLPKILFDSELNKIKEIAKEIGFEYHIIDTDMTALGNNIVCTKKGCLVNPELEENAKEQIEKALGMPIKEGKIANIPTVGSLVVCNSKGCAIHRDAEDFETEFVTDTLGINAETASVNMGNPFLKSGLLVNSNGFIAGETSGGPEITYLDEIFGFLE